MGVTHPISMAGTTLQELGSSDGLITVQKSGGLPSPERSGSPELNARSSQWKLDRLAYASKDNAHQIDDWPEAHTRKSEDVLVRYKDTRGSKGVSTRMDPHAWSDLPTDTDDEFAETASSPAWTGAHDALSPKSLTGSKAGEQLPKPTVTTPRKLEALKAEADQVLKVQCLDDHWETVALDSALQQDADTKWDGENERGVLTSTTSGHERVPTVRNNIPSRFSYVKSPSRQKSALDEQATMKMSHRYYTSGVDSNRRRTSYTPSRVVAKGHESGREEIHHRNRKSRTHSVTESSSSTSVDSDCSDVECKKVGSAVDSEESFRQMILQKYLVMMPGKPKKMQAMVRASKDMKAGRCKSPSTTKLWSGANEHRYFTGKNLHPISSQSRPPSWLQMQVPKKKVPCKGPDARADPVRQTVSQPAAVVIQALQKLEPPPPQKEQASHTVPGKNSLVLLLRKSWSSGDLHQSKSLGDICTLNGHPLSHRDIVDMENALTDQEKRAIELQIRSKAPKVVSEEEPLATNSGESCIAVEVKHDLDEVCPSEGQSIFTNVGSTLPVEVSTVEVADFSLTKKVSAEFRCDCFPPSVLSKAQFSELSGEMGVAEHQVQGRVTGQGLSALALFPGTENDSENSLKSTNDAPVLVELVAGVEERSQVKLHGEGARESSNSHHPAAGRQPAEEASNGFKFRINKVPAVVPFGSCESDQVLPDVSLAGPPAPHTLLELQHEVESKQHHMSDERRQQVSRTGMLAQQKRGFWDSSHELQREKQALLKRLQELEVHHPCNRLKAMSGTKVQLTEEDAKRLRQEILEQEALIRGYQVENEKAVAKLKEVQLETKQKLQEMAEEKAHLASQLANRHMQSYGTDSASLHEKLQGALSRETALRMDLDKMRDSYSELEKRVKTEESSRMKDLELKLTTLHETLEAERQSHAQMEGRKQAMIQQEELIASLQETVSDQASKIRALTVRLEGGGEGQNEAQQQIETLQTQVKRLEQSLRAAKKETGLHALQVAKSGMEENETFRRMQAELVAVQRHAQQREEETNRIIHHLKVENDKIKHEFVTRIRNLKQQIQTRAQSGNSISESELSALNRVKDLEKQVANLRIHYSRKVKELSEKLEEASKPKLEEVLGRSRTAPPSRAATTRLIQPAQGKALREAKERIALQEDVISQKDRTIKSLQTQLQAMESNRPGPTCTVVPGPMVQGETQTKEGHCSSSTSEQEPMNLRNDITAADEVAELRRKLEKSELTREVLQKACNESVEKAVLLTLQHQQALQLRQSQMKHHRSSECQTPLAGWGGLEGMTWLSERSSSEMANRAMEARFRGMSEELEEANSMCQQSPRMQQIMNLKKKVAEMEVRQQQKEMEWQKVLQETKQTSSIEQEYAERKWREALNSKSMEVEKIRLELNAIIEAAMAMQQAQLQKT